MRIAFSIVFLFSSVAGLAQDQPTLSAGDPRLQTVVYDPDQVVPLTVSGGYQLMISFSAGEHVETIAIGDSTAWQVTANKRADYLFVKNLGATLPTNLTVVTEARVYNFLLEAGNGPPPVFNLRFAYPESTRSRPVAVKEQVRYRYRISGSRAIRPKNVSIGEVGDRVILEWSEANPMPATYQIDDEGREAMVESVVEEGALIVAGVPRKLVFRLGKKVARATRSRARKGKV